LDRRKQSKHQSDGFSERPASRKTLLELERGSYLKKWTGLLPVALFYPNTYQVGMSSLGFQIVYHLLNRDDRIVCERLFLDERLSPRLSSVESDRPVNNFPVLFCSVSFEHDYVNIARLLLAAGIEPIAENRPDEISAQNPILICGGVATFMNPEPLAPFFDLFVIGEAEPLILPLLDVLCEDGSFSNRCGMLFRLNRDHGGFYAPRFYNPSYGALKELTGYTVQDSLPKRIRKVILKDIETASHSEILTPQTEFADLFLAELGRGCSRGCRFCAAGYIYRPARLWNKEAVIRSLLERPEGIHRIGLLGMEMSSEHLLESIAAHINQQGCSLSFSSLRADRISDEVIELLSKSELKSVAIAPDGASERLRRVINKNLKEDDLLDAAQRLVSAGLFKLKLYLMIGLPTETEEDLAEFLLLIEKIRSRIDPIGRQRGRLCEISISVNSFVPKPWTPFQYHPYGVSRRLEGAKSVAGAVAVKALKGKIRFLKAGLRGIANTRVKFDNPDHVLFQAILARGDRRIASVLLEMAVSGISWKRAMKQQDLSEELFATRQYLEDSCLPWQLIDHSIRSSFLWKEYEKAFKAKVTGACDTSSCRRCGVCNDAQDN